MLLCTSRVLFGIINGMAFEDFQQKVPYLEFLTSEAQSALIDLQEQIEAEDVVDFLLATVSPYEELILKMRFGLLGRREHSTNEIAQHLQRSPSWVRQRQARALRKLRSAPSLESMRSFLEWKKEHLEKDEIASIELFPVVEKITQLTPDLIEHLRSHSKDLDNLRWDVFERLVAEFFASWGWEDVRLVGRNNKTSADIFAAYILNPLGVKVRYFVEVKRWKHKVGVQIIDQVYGAMLSERQAFGWHAAMIVSVVGFKDFEKYSRETLTLKGVELKDRNDLLMWLKGYKPNKNGLWLPQPSTEI